MPKMGSTSIIIHVQARIGAIHQEECYHGSHKPRRPLNGNAQFQFGELSELCHHSFFPLSVFLLFFLCPLFALLALWSGCE